MIIIKFGTAHAGIGRVFPVIFLLVLTSAYERILKPVRIEEVEGGAGVILGGTV